MGKVKKLLFNSDSEYGIILIGDYMKNYRVTAKGKIIFLITFVLLSVLLVSQSQLALIVLGVILSILVFLGLDFYFSIKKEKVLKDVNSKTCRNEKDALINSTEIRTEMSSLETKMQKIDDHEKYEKTSEYNTEESLSPVENEEVSYADVIDDIDELDETLKNMTSDLKEISRNKKNKASKVVDEEINKETIKEIKAYYLDKRKNLNPIDRKEKRVSEDIQPPSIMEMIREFLSTLIKRNPYKIGSLVYHEHFGVGQVIESSDQLKVSFYNNQLKDIIEFEFDNKGNVPEIKAFQIPKGEDIRHYHYNYKDDISKDLLEVLKQLRLNFKDVALLPNLSFANEAGYENYMLLVVSDLVHVFYLENPPSKKPLKLLIETASDDINIKVHKINDFKEINSILFKSKVKSQIDIHQVERIGALLLEENIENYSERQHLQSN